MYAQFTKRSMYDMFEVKSVVQKVLRMRVINWAEFFYFMDEYLDTMRENKGKMALFLTEDAARCPMPLLRHILKILKAPKSAGRIQYFRAFAGLSRQPVDRSAAYLSVACLESLIPLSEERQRTLIDECPGKWSPLLESNEEEGAKRWFCACMSLLHSEADNVSHEYPMTPCTALQLAEAVSHLVGWDSKYPKVRLAKEVVPRAIPNILDRNFAPTNTVRPLTLGFKVVFDWMTLAKETLDPRARAYVELYAQIALACSSTKDSRLDLMIMNALLVLMGRFPDETTPDYLELPCDPDEIPTEPRRYSMPVVAQDKHTARGSKLANTTNMLISHCLRKGIPVPANVDYSHGPAFHSSPQGFDEFMKHILSCEEETSDGTPAAFKTEAMNVYRSVPPGTPQKRMAILKAKLLLSTGEAPTVRKGKRKAETSERGAKRRRFLDAVNETWLQMTSDRPIGQKPTGRKPSVFIDKDRRRVIKGPLSTSPSRRDGAFRSICLTRLAREVLGLENCIPEQRLVVTIDGKIGQCSPLIGDPGEVTGEGVVSPNETRGLCKLHDYADDWVTTLANPEDVLRIVVAKNIVLSSDNNTSNIVIEHKTKRVHGLDLGGWAKKPLEPNNASLDWALSKRPSKRVLSKMNGLVARYAKNMVEWLESLKSSEVLENWQKVTAQHLSEEMAVGDFCARVDLFLNFFQNTSLK